MLVVRSEIAARGGGDFRGGGEAANLPRGIFIYSAQSCWCDQNPRGLNPVILHTGGERGEKEKGHSPCRSQAKS